MQLKSFNFQKFWKLVKSNPIVVLLVAMNKKKK